MSKICTSKNYKNLINQKVGTNTPFSKLFKDLRCQIFPLCSKYPKPAYLVIEGPRRIWKMEDYSVSLRILDLDLLQVSYKIFSL